MSQEQHPSFASLLDGLRRQHQMSVVELCRRRGVSRGAWYAMLSSPNLHESVARSWAETITGRPVQFAVRFEASPGVLPDASRPGSPDASEPCRGDASSPATRDA